MHAKDAIPVVSIDLWQDTNDPGLGGVQPKRWLRRADGQRAIFKEPVRGPSHVCELVGSRLAGGLGFVVPTVQLYLHAARQWGALVYELPRPHMTFADLAPPERDPIASGADRVTLTNDSNLRAMRLVDAIVRNGDRHDGNHMVSVELSRDAAPRRLRHALTDFGFSYWGDITPGDLDQAVAGAGGVIAYTTADLQSVRDQLRYARDHWWAEVRPFCLRFREGGEDFVDAILAQVPEEIALGVHLACIQERVKQSRQIVEEFIAENE